MTRTLEVAIRICLLDHDNRVFTMDILTLALADARLRYRWLQFSDTVRK